MVDNDEVLRHIGGFGTYQRRLCLLLSLTAIPYAGHMLAMAFLGAKPPHHCSVAGLDNITVRFGKDDGLRLVFPGTTDDGVWTYSSCERYDLGSASVDDVEPWNTTGLPEIPCDHGWWYDTSRFKTSVTMEHDLVCGRKWMGSLAQSIFMVGVLLGAVIFGDLSDRFGRKKIYFLSLFIMLVFGVSTAFAHNYWLFVFLRMIIGATNSGVFLTAFVLASELVSPDHRTLISMFLVIFFGVGGMMLSLMAYLIRYWEWLQLAISLPNVLFIMVYWWVINESPRWLLANNQKEYAVEIFRKVADANKKVIPEGLFEDTGKTDDDKADGEPKPRHNLIDLVRTPNVRRKSLIMFYAWFVAGFVFYGLSLNATNLAGNPYLNFFVSCAVEIPAYILAKISMDRIGRRWSLLAFLLVAGLATFCIMFIPAAYSKAITVLAVFGKFGAAGCFGTIYVFATEIFPTVVRNVGIGASSMCARIGAIVAPFVFLLHDVWSPLPYLTSGTFALVAAGLVLLLPETLGTKLPQSLAESENFTRNTAQATTTTAAPNDAEANKTAETKV
ncbi:SLC22A5 [Branchiostoma lanceolatum]|uniref:SLC22A5 protein n=1 Tax=Branchiostoma lanceolatum TaxID=7740 RepID=A0A8J9YU24_BRALA|nr:SLC22A5 [Branchiostoma lanceolatum]